jgi:hypothetical protein
MNAMSLHLGWEEIALRLAAAGERRSLSFRLRYAPKPGDVRVPPVVAALAREPGVAKVDWRPL